MRLIFSLIVAFACLFLNPLTAAALALAGLARSTVQLSGHRHLMPTAPRSIFETRRMGLA